MSTCPLPPGSIVAAYCRDSGGAEQENSTEQQLQEIRVYTTEHQLTLPTALIFTDKERSGTTTEHREGFYRMIAALDVAPRPCAAVILYSSSRFARNQNDAAFYRAMLKRMGYIILYASGDVPNDAGDIQPVLETLADWKNARFIADMKREIKRGMHWSMEQGAFLGEAPAGFTRQPFELGLKRNGKPRAVSRLAVDEAIAPAIRLAFQMRADGKTLSEIHAVTHIYDGFRPSYHYSRMLRNPIYKGDYYYNGTLVHANYVPAIVEPELWERVQHIMQARREQAGVHHRRRVTNDNFALTGLLYCSECDIPLWARQTTYTTKESKSQYRYYVCPRTQLARACPVHGGAKPIEAAVIAKIRRAILAPAALARLEKRLTTTASQRDKHIAAEIKAHQKRLAQLEKEIDNLTASAARAPLSAALAKRLQATEQAADEVRQAIAHPAASSNTAPLDIRAIATDLTTAIESNDLRAIRQNLALFIARIDLTPTNEIVIHYREL